MSTQEQGNDPHVIITTTAVVYDDGNSGEEWMLKRNRVRHGNGMVSTLSIYPTGENLEPLLLHYGVKHTMGRTLAQTILGEERGFTVEYQHRGGDHNSQVECTLRMFDAETTWSMIVETVRQARTFGKNVSIRVLPAD